MKKEQLVKKGPMSFSKERKETQKKCKQVKKRRKKKKIID